MVPDFFSQWIMQIELLHYFALMHSRGRPLIMNTYTTALDSLRAIQRHLNVFLILLKNVTF